MQIQGEDVITIFSLTHIFRAHWIIRVQTVNIDIDIERMFKRRHFIHTEGFLRPSLF